MCIAVSLCQTMLGLSLDQEKPSNFKRKVYSINDCDDILVYVKLHHEYCVASK